MINPIILSGGSGTRLWPLSRANYPKQYLSLFNNQTLLQETILRITKPQFNPPTIICNNEHRFIVAEQLQNINITPSNIILETESKNTAPAIAIACLLQEEYEQLLLVLPADHIIKNPELLYNAIEDATPIALNGKIVTFGITPTTPETRYGYIECGELILNQKKLYNVNRFLEKPNITTAKELFSSGKYYWNSGIFLFKANVMLNELEKIQPLLLKSCQNTLSCAKQDLDFLRLNSKLIDNNSNYSIDYAVMEHTKHAAVMPIDLEWSDLGTWDALWDESQKNQQNNVIIGDVITTQVNNSYIYTENQLVTVIGLNDLIVAATQDAILISPKDHISQIKNLTQELKNNNRSEVNDHKKTYRPWGYYQIIDLANKFKVKRIMIKPGGKTSTQMHYHRAEHWVVVEGIAIITKGEETLLLHENESIYIPIRVKHRIENNQPVPLHIIEIQSGSYLEEDDIVRIEDVYGRVGLPDLYD